MKIPLVLCTALLLGGCYPTLISRTVTTDVDTLREARRACNAQQNTASWLSVEIPRPHYEQPTRYVLRCYEHVQIE